MKNNVDVSVVVPVFNEEESIEQCCKELSNVLKSHQIDYELIFVDDGSRDRSFELLTKCRAANPNRIRILKLGRNFGHQLALTAGLRVAQGKAVVVTDADLQDPTAVIIEFIQKWREGYLVVYGVRTDRRGETFFKKQTASLFYKILRRLTNIDIPENAGDFYLLDRKVVDILNAMEERHRFLRGLIVWVGFKRVAVNYARQPRYAGTTKYSLWRMVKFSFDAATSFSFRPLRAISIFGFIISFVAFLTILWAFYMKLFTDQTVAGWASLMSVVLFIGGIQLLAIGLIGEYVARLGDDVKGRPLYTVEEFLE